MTAAPLEISRLTAGYGPTRVLEDVSFAVPAGARLAVLGRNGVGKSTLLATIAGQTTAPWRRDQDWAGVDIVSIGQRLARPRWASAMCRRSAASSRR